MMENNIGQYIRGKYPLLSNFLDAIWNQNYPEEYDSVKNAVNFYLSLSRYNIRDEFARELEGIIFDAEVLPYIQKGKKSYILAKEFGNMAIWKEDILRILQVVLNPPSME